MISVAYTVQIQYKLILCGSFMCFPIGIRSDESHFFQIKQHETYLAALIAKSDMVSLVDSLVAPLSIVNALIVSIAAKKEAEISQTFANLERIWDEYNVYEKQVDGE